MSTSSRTVRVGIPLTVVCAIVVVLAPTATADGPPKFPWEGPAIRAKPGSLVVTFASGTSAAQRRAIHGAVGAHVTDRAATSAIEIVELPAGLSPLAAIRRYQADPRVVAAELDRYALPTEIPDDQHFETQWGLRNVEQPHPISESGYVPQDMAGGTNDADVRRIAPST